MHVTQPIPQLPPDFAWLQPLIDRTMNKQPAERVQTGAILAEEIHQLLAKSPEGAATLSKTAAKSSNRISSGATMQRTRMIKRDAGYPRWLWPAVAAGVVAIGVGGWLLLRQPEPLPPAKVLTVQPITASGAGDATVPIGSESGDTIIHPKPIEEELGGDVEQMLTQADEYTKYGTTNKTDPGRHLTDSTHPNAVELYQKVLEAQPDNPKAKKGLKTIADYYADKAQQLCGKQMWAGCQIIAEEGLKAEPDDPTLKQLDKQADDAVHGNAPSGN